MHRLSSLLKLKLKLYTLSIGITNGLFSQGYDYFILDYNLQSYGFFLVFQG